MTVKQEEAVRILVSDFLEHLERQTVALERIAECLSRKDIVWMSPISTVVGAEDCGLSTARPYPVE